MKKSRKGMANSPQVGLQVWANADYPRDARMAIKFGAQGIGLCRTEHMFFETERLPIVQKMILAEDRRRTPEISRSTFADSARRFRRHL